MRPLFGAARERAHLGETGGEVGGVSVQGRRMECKQKQGTEIEKKSKSGTTPSPRGASYRNVLNPV
jgi:hypothetical protein